jgi:hypothetical protein
VLLCQVEDTSLLRCDTVPLGRHVHMSSSSGSPCSWEHYIPVTYQKLLTEQHVVTFEKTCIINNTAVKTLNVAHTQLQAINNFSYLRSSQSFVLLFFSLLC